MARPIEYHRSDEFRRVIGEIEDGLRYVYQTTSDVVVLASSGTGAMECAVVNLFSPGDAVIGVRSGKFGERWGELAAAYGLDFVPIDLEWGQSVEPEQVRRALEAHPHAKAVLATLCETSTGALHDIQALGELTATRDTLLVVDAVSALGADEIRMDAWRVDALVSCSQKGLMTPPGLGFCSLGERALEASKTSRLPKYYFSYAKALRNLRQNETPYTPAVSLLYGLHAALGIIRSEGIEAAWERHARMARATAAAVTALGLELFPARPANTLTSIRVPERFDGKALVRRIRSEHGTIFAGGQDHLAGKIVRIAHLGWMDDYDALVAVAALERGLRELGWRVPAGVGVAAAQAALASKDLT
jgi:aspartate aminotransferase-like enzyme